VGVTETGIKVADEFDREAEIAADSVVLAAGFRPNRELIEGLRSHPGLRVAEAGDCIRPRKIFDAIHDGHLAAKLLDSAI
jgi:hypothetical protein